MAEGAAAAITLMRQRQQAAARARPRAHVDPAADAQDAGEGGDEFKDAALAARGLPVPAAAFARSVTPAVASRRVQVQCTSTFVLNLVRYFHRRYHTLGNCTHGGPGG